MAMSYGKLHVQPDNGDDKSKTIDLRILSNPLKFGWNEGCGIRILRKQVAGEHAQITRDKAGKVWLVQLDTVYHTLVNGELVKEPVLLKDKDTISIAGRDFIYEEVLTDFSSLNNGKHMRLSPPRIGKPRYYDSSPPSSTETSPKSQSSYSNIPKPEEDHPKNVSDVGYPTTDISQNSITNPKREHEAKKRCVAINFNIHKKLEFGYGLYIAGSSPALCDWSKKDHIECNGLKGIIGP